MAKFTEGNWVVVNPDMGIIASSADGTHICEVGAYGDADLLPYNKERWDADRALICAAKDMHKALIQCQKLFRNILADDRLSTASVVLIVEQALIKADGIK